MLLISERSNLLNHLKAIQLFRKEGVAFLKVVVVLFLRRLEG